MRFGSAAWLFFLMNTHVALPPRQMPVSFSRMAVPYRLTAYPHPSFVVCSSTPRCAASKPGDWGPSCANPGALKGALLGAVQASGQPARGSRAKAASGSSSSSSSSSSSGGGKAGSGAFARGVRANLLLGGDNCSRGVLLGALLAAEVCVCVGGGSVLAAAGDGGWRAEGASGRWLKAFAHAEGKPDCSVPLHANLFDSVCPGPFLFRSAARLPVTLATSSRPKALQQP